MMSWIPNQHISEHYVLMVLEVGTSAYSAISGLKRGYIRISEYTGIFPR